MLQIRCKFRPATAEFIYSISSGKSVGVVAVSGVAVAPPPVTVPLNFFEDTHGVVQTAGGADPLFFRGGGGGFSLIYEGLLARCPPHPPSNLPLAGPDPVGKYPKCTSPRHVQNQFL